MATATSAPQPPTPKRERVNSNDHPYAIKTTSTALLTRSNSTGNRPQSAHSYTPISPSPSSPSMKGYHRATRSLSNASASDLPKPLPMPPSPGTPVRFANGAGGGDTSDSETGIRRSSTLPMLSSSPADGESPSVAKLLALPENPKLWTPSHLANYLTSTLRFKQDANLPDRIAQDLSHFVYEHKLTGRVFLRLTETDLNDMGVNPLWRDALLTSSRSLRKRVLQGRIWGFGSPVADAEMKRARRFPSTVDESENENDGEEPSSPVRPTNAGHVRVDSTGRVRAMAASFERTASTGSSDGGHAPRTPSSHTRVDTGGSHEAEEEILSASDVSDIELTEEEAAQLLAEQDAAKAGAPMPQTPEPIPVPDVAIVVEPEGDGELSVEQLLAADGASAWEDADNEGDGDANGTAKRLVPTLKEITPTSRAGSRKGTGRSRPATIGRKNGAPLADLFRPEPPVSPAPPAEPAATAEEVAALRARVAELESRIEQIAQREAETRRLLEEARAAQLQLEIAHVQAELAREQREQEEAHEKEERAREEHGMLAPSIGQLPTYAVLVGVGLCAVIVRSVLRKFAVGRAR